MKVKTCTAHPGPACKQLLSHVLPGLGQGVFEVARARAEERIKEFQNITRESTVACYFTYAMPNTQDSTLGICARAAKPEAVRKKSGQTRQTKVTTRKGATTLPFLQERASARNARCSV